MIRHLVQIGAQVRVWPVLLVTALWPGHKGRRVSPSPIGGVAEAYGVWLQQCSTLWDAKKAKGTQAHIALHPPCVRSIVCLRACTFRHSDCCRSPRCTRRLSWWGCGQGSVASHADRADTEAVSGKASVLCPCGGATGRPLQCFLCRRADRKQWAEWAQQVYPCSSPPGEASLKIDTGE